MGLVRKKKPHILEKVNIELNREKVVLHKEVVKRCTEQIQGSNKPNPLARVDPNRDRKAKLCELQIQVLEKSKIIAELQSKLTDIILDCPESVSTVTDLKRTLDDIHSESMRRTNSYGYGQDVLNIAWTTIDSVKNLVNQLPVEEHDSNCPKSTDQRVYRSLSENSARAKREKQNVAAKRDAMSRGRSMSSYTVTDKAHAVQPDFIESSGIKSRDIRALSNLDIGESGDITM